MFIDEWFEGNFYVKRKSGSSHSFGQIFWTHAYYPHENLELWRPVRVDEDPTITSATNFRIEPAGSNAFNRGIPLASPSLKTNEELIVMRAKKRPVILIRPESAPMGPLNRGFKGKIDRHLCLVAQVFGLADTKTGAAKFNPSFVARVRQMEWPEFFFLPQQAGLLDVDSLLRLDEVQSVFTPHLEVTQWSLSEDVVEILRAQLGFFMTNAVPNAYMELRQLLITS